MRQLKETPLFRKLLGNVAVIGVLYRLIRRGRLAWLIHFAQGRAQYSLEALYLGTRMNHCGQGLVANFRRNIHRLEKGLLYGERKACFAQDYISETVESLGRIRSAPAVDVNTIMWGEAVLDQYFKASEHAGRIADAYRRYQQLKPENRQPTWHPYCAKQRPELTVNYEALQQLARRRRSVRFFLDKVVDFEVVEQAMKVAALAPSACNRQSFQFLFFNEKETVKSISQLPGGCAGYEMPAVIIVTGSYRGYFDERDVNVPIIDASLAVMSFLFALETLGLSSVCLNWPALPDRDEALRKIVDLEGDEVVVMLIGVGYPDPDGKVACSAKRDLAGLVKCNERLLRDRAGIKK